MNRLIDADKLRANFPEPTDWKDSKQALVHITGIWAEIDAAETVPAIPIDWLNQRIETLVETGGLLANLGAALVMKMVEEWEKEQNGKVD